MVATLIHLESLFASYLSCEISRHSCWQPFVRLCRRWDLTRLNSKRTCVFKPTALDAESGSRDNLKKALLGAVYHGDYQKIPRANHQVGLVWEAATCCLIHMHGVSC